MKAKLDNEISKMPKTGNFTNVYTSILNSTQKSIEEVTKIICDKNTNKVSKIETYKLFEKGVNMICDIS